MDQRRHSRLNIRHPKIGSKTIMPSSALPSTSAHKASIPRGEWKNRRALGRPGNNPAKIRMEKQQRKILI
jgi:hypothetical protein